MNFDFTTETITPEISSLLTIGGTGALELPSGTTAQEPAGVTAGAIRWNTDQPQLEYFNGTAWLPLNNGGVTSVTGTTNQITASPTTGAVVLTIPSTFTAPGSITATTTLTVSGNTASAFLYSNALKQVVTTAAPTNGQLLIGSTSANPVVAALTQGTGITITNGAGSITITNAGVTSLTAGTGIGVSASTGSVTISNTGVTSFSAGTTGLTPNTSTTGAITLAGTLGIANGGTGLTSTPANGQVDIGNGTGFTRTTLTQGTGITVTNGSGSITITNAGVTSFLTSLSGLTPSTSTTGAITLAGTLGVASGGTGLTSSPTNGQLLIGNGTNYALATLTAGTAIGITNASGSITINNIGVTSLTGTTNQITTSASTGAVTLSLPSTLVAPGSVTATTTLTVSGNTASSFVYSNASQQIVTTTAPTNGQLLIGSSGGNPVLGTISTSGSGISVTNGTGTITLANTGVTSLTGTTNQVNVSASTGAVTLSLPQSINTTATPTFNQVTISNNPVNPTDTVNLQYLQSIVSGLEWKDVAQAATVTNLTATYANGSSGVGATLTNNGTQAPFVVDGYTANLNDRILVKNQTTQLQNGIYSVTTQGSGSTNWVLTRTTDANTSSSLNNATLYVTNGTTNIDTAWTQTTANPTVGTSNIVFVQMAGTGTYTAGTGLTLTTNQFSLTLPVAVNLGGTGLTTAPANGQLLIGNGTNYALATLTAGTAIGITNASGSITINNTGVTSFSTSLSGLTPNTSTTGAITLAGTLGIASGGTGLTATPTNGQIDIGNGTGFTRTTLTSGTAVGITNASGSITINNTGVTSIAGTANQITASASTGAVTLSLPTTVDVTNLYASGQLLQSIATVAAGGTTQGTATALTASVTNVTSGTGGVALPTPLSAGWDVVVANRSGSTINVYPASGGSIESLGTNNPIAIPNGSDVEFTSSSTTQWGVVFGPLSAGTGTSVAYSGGIATVTNAGVTSFNTRTGAVTLTSGDVATAEGLTTGALFVGTGTNTGSALTIGTTGQVLTSNGTTATWSNAVGTAYTAVVIPNTLVSGNYYSATITHNLGTNNIVVSVYDNSTEAYIIPHALIQTSTNVLTIQVVGNVRTYRVVIIANGASIQAGGSTPSSIIVQNQGVTLTGSPFTTVNLAAGLTATNTGSGVATITPLTTIIKQFTFYPASLDTPNNSDWTVNNSAPTTPDPTYSSILVRQFSTSTEGGVGCFVTVPSNSTQITLNFKGRAQTAPSAAAVIQPKLYVRSIPNNAAVGAWGAANVLSVQTVPTNANFQYYTQAAAALSTYGMAASGLYLLELTLSTAPTSGTNLTGNWLMTEFTISFS